VRSPFASASAQAACMTPASQIGTANIVGVPDLDEAALS
jgi:Na+/alanine symporter